MWLLRNNDKGLIFRVYPGKQNIVSRKDGDLLLFGDQSISRKHAELSVHNENENQGVILKDLGSKYGTFTVLGGGELTQVSSNQQVTLKHGDAIRFGIQWNIWRVEYFPLVVATSTLNTGEKTEVKQVVSTLGGTVVSDWQPCCTHLTMNKLTVTVKVVCALACGKPIVVPGYWKALKEVLASAQAKISVEPRLWTEKPIGLPDCQNFVPPLAEALLNPSEVSFTPNPERSSLFNGYTFVAASARQLTRIKPMVTAAGGNAVEFCASLWPDSKLVQDKTILMQHTAADKQGSQQSQVPDGYIPTARKLKATGVRCVPESEIGLSILYCSLAQYCNPRFNHQSLFSGSSSQSTQQIPLICPNNQEPINPQSDEVKSGSTNHLKRVHEDSFEEEQNPSKKINNKSNSEDMFCSPRVESKTDINSNKSSLSLKRPGPEGKKSVAIPSLDMFAPSGQSDQSKVEKPTIVNPSLDMFAPSGQVSNKKNKNEVDISCQDLFATNESRQSGTNKSKISGELSSIASKQPRVAQVEDNDDNSFTTNKKTGKLKKTVLEKDDEFSFRSTRKSKRKNLIDEDDGDEFSFETNKKTNYQKMGEDQGDEFSFASNKGSKKRNGKNNPEMLNSIAECSRNNDRLGGYQSDTRNNCKTTSDENDLENDDLFAFAGPAPKRKKNKDFSLNLDEEVKLALLSKKDDLNSGPQNASEPIVFDDPPDKKDLITYSKDKSHPVKIKEEVRDEEMDELAKELYDATIVVVDSLVKQRPKPLEAQSTSSGKNFKKFRKVTALNKRIVPRIIGGSDLIEPYTKRRDDMDDLRPPSPPRQSPDDDWEFPKEKKKGKK